MCYIQKHNIVNTAPGWIRHNSWFSSYEHAQPNNPLWLCHCVTVAVKQSKHSANIWEARRVRPLPEWVLTRSRWPGPKNGLCCLVNSLCLLSVYHMGWRDITSRSGTRLQWSGLPQLSCWPLFSCWEIWANTTMFFYSGNSRKHSWIHSHIGHWQQKKNYTITMATSVF